MSELFCSFCLLLFGLLVNINFHNAQVVPEADPEPMDMEAKSTSHQNTRNSTENSIIWKGNYLLIFNETSDGSLNDRFLVEEAPIDPKATLEQLEQATINATNSSREICKNLNIFVCLEKACKWVKGRCFQGLSLNSTEKSFPAPLPTSINDVVYLLEVMWNHPPGEPPFLWAVFLGSSLAIVSLMLFVGSFVLLYFSFKCCCQRRTRDQEPKKQRKLTVILPHGRRIPIEDFILEGPEEEKTLVILPGNISTLQDVQFESPFEVYLRSRFTTPQPEDLPNVPAVQEEEVEPTTQPKKTTVDPLPGTSQFLSQIPVHLKNITTTSTQGSIMLTGPIDFIPIPDPIEDSNLMENNITLPKGSAKKRRKGPDYVRISLRDLVPPATMQSKEFSDEGKGDDGKGDDGKGDEGKGDEGKGDDDKGKESKF